MVIMRKRIIAVAAAVVAVMYASPPILAQSPHVITTSPTQNALNVSGDVHGLDFYCLRNHVGAVCGNDSLRRADPDRFIMLLVMAPLPFRARPGTPTPTTISMSAAW